MGTPLGELVAGWVEDVFASWLHAALLAVTINKMMERWDDCMGWARVATSSAHAPRSRAILAFWFTILKVIGHVVWLPQVEAISMRAVLYAQAVVALERRLC